MNDWVSDAHPEKSHRVRTAPKNTSPVAMKATVAPTSIPERCVLAAELLDDVLELELEPVEEEWEADVEDAVFCAEATDAEYTDSAATGSFPPHGLFRQAS